MKCQYISAVDKVIFVDDYAVGCRKDLNGILLLDTALQTPVSKQDDVVQLELPVTEVSWNKYPCTFLFNVISVLLSIDEIRLSFEDMYVALQKQTN